MKRIIKIILFIQMVPIVSHAQSKIEFVTNELGVFDLFFISGEDSIFATKQDKNLFQVEEDDYRKITSGENRIKIIVDKDDCYYSIPLELKMFSSCNEVKIDISESTSKRNLLIYGILYCGGNIESTGNLEKVIK